MSSAPRVLLVGAQGRMGKAVAAAAPSAGLTIVAGLERGDAIAPAVASCDVVIDFSSPEATAEICRVGAEERKPLVIGTTGLSAEQKNSITAAARAVPIVYAANFSIGINALFALTRQVAKSLGEDFDLEIIEMHHRTKKDAPSGTAKRLVEILEETRGDKKSVPVHSLRAGDIVGDHQIIFAGPGERLELTHRAASRETFARGALQAARWVIGKPPGLYSMENVLGF